ncbi:M48 family metallopeptidase [Embleya hyalina]|uniref:Zn-dependent protease n=1 Tax=Embleya hyalina TaxID=516124 RepID=A0A401YJY8_9ACTN|nr:M48 family metallopeptidase [Embleya hyalina]GCD94849.1 Zn-dependent protease [Embleya hyalina]
MSSDSIWLACTAETTDEVPYWGQVIILGVPGLFAVMRRLRATGQSVGSKPGSVPVTRRQAPELWRTVTDLAERIGTAPPSRIRLTMETNAAVVDDSAFGEQRGTRRMYIGLPLLAGLGADRLRAVPAHELAHYARGHTWIAAMTHRGSVLVHSARHDRIGWKVNSFAIPRFALSVYGRCYDLLSLAIRRRQEFEADAVAARIVGRDALAEALAMTPEIDLAWRDFQDRFLTPMCAEGRAPDDPLRVFANMLADPEYRDRLESRSANHPESAGSRHDSHPPLGDRLAALAEMPCEPAGADREPTPVLLEATGTLPATVWPALARLRTGRAQVSRPWATWLREATRLETTRALRELATPVGLIATSRARSRSGVSSADVLDLLEAGRGRELSAALRATAWGQRRWELADEDQLPIALGSLVGHELVAAKRGTWQVNWVGPGVFRPADAEAGAAHALVGGAASDPATAHELRTRLDACGVDVTRPVAAPSESDVRGRRGGAATAREAADPSTTARSTTSEQRTKAAVVLVGAVLLSVLTRTFARIHDTPPPFRPSIPVGSYAGYPTRVAPTFGSAFDASARPTALPSHRFPIDDWYPLPSLTLRPREWTIPRTGSTGRP